MSVTVLAYTIVGVPIDVGDLYHRRSVTVHADCTDKGDGKFCSQCGKPMDAMEIIEEPFPGYDREGGPSYTGTFDGLEIVKAYWGDTARAFLAYAYVVDDSDRAYCDDSAGPKKLPDDVDLVEARDKLREVLEPHGLWKPETFGTWAAVYYS